jgi:hypothetical protein
VRVVLTPEAVVVAEARRSLTMLSLFGYRVDGVIANRVFPTDGQDPWLAGWVQQQSVVLDDLRDSFTGLPIWVGPYQSAEPVGGEALRAFAGDLYGDEDALAAPSSEDPMTITREADLTVLELALPFATKERVDLVRRGEELSGHSRQLSTVAHPADISVETRRCQSRGQERATEGALPGESERLRMTDQDVGSVGEEAAKLLGALGDWARPSLEAMQTMSLDLPTGLVSDYKT